LTPLESLLLPTGNLQEFSAELIGLCKCHDDFVLQVRMIPKDRQDFALQLGMLPYFCEDFPPQLGIPFDVRKN
jgi:hypothetical protein